VSVTERSDCSRRAFRRSRARNSANVVIASPSGGASLRLPGRPRALRLRGSNLALLAEQCDEFVLEEHQRPANFDVRDQTLFDHCIKRVTGALEEVGGLAEGR
jgi:hypothetical protein